MLGKRGKWRFEKGRDMKAVIIDKVTKAEDIILSEAEIPEVKKGWVLIKVKGFGLNHSEQILRMSEINASYIHNPSFPGSNASVSLKVLPTQISKKDRRSWR